MLRQVPTWVSVPVLALSLTSLTGCLGGGGGGGGDSTPTSSSADRVGGSDGSSGTGGGAAGGTGDGSEEEAEGLAITSRTPADGAEGVELMPVISATLDAELDPATVNEDTFVLANAATTVEPQQVFAEGNEAHFVLDGELALSSQYRAKLNSPEQGARIKGADGEVLNGLHPWHFTTRDGTWQPPQILENINPGRDSIGLYDGIVLDLEFDEEGDGWAIFSLKANTVRDHLYAVPYIQGSGWGTATRVAITDGFMQRADVEIAPDGRAVLAYDVNPDGINHIMAATFMPGSGWSLPERIGDGHRSDVGESELQLAIGSDGGAVATWVQNRFVQNESSHLWLVTFAWGEGWTAPQDLSTLDQQELYDPDLDISPAGQGVLTWIEGGSVYASQLSGGSVAEPIMIADNADRNTEVGIDAQGNALAVWTGDAGLLSRRFVKNEGWQEPSTVAEGGAPVAPDLAMNAKGFAALVYHGDSQNGRGLFATNFNLDYGWDAPTLLTGAATLPDLDIDGVGNAIAVWGESEQDSTDILASRYTRAHGWSTPSLIEQSGETALNAVVGLNALSGRGAAIWSQQTGPDAGSTSDEKFWDIWVSNFR